MEQERMKVVFDEIVTDDALLVFRAAQAMQEAAWEFLKVTWREYQNLSENTPAQLQIKRALLDHYYWAIDLAASLKPADLSIVTDEYGREVVKHD
jgi:hypothetical protein